MKNSVKQELLDYAVEQIAELDLDLNNGRIKRVFR